MNWLTGFWIIGWFSMQLKTASDSVFARFVHFATVLLVTIAPSVSAELAFETQSTSPLPNDADTRLLLHFDGELMGVNGELPADSNGLSFEPGVMGDSVYVPSPEGLLVYYQEDNVSAAEGTVEFWLKPAWKGSQDTKTRLFFNAGLSFNHGMLLSIDGANNLRFIQWGDVIHIGSDSSGSSQAEAAFDEFRVSGRQRSDEEIWEDYSSGLPDGPQPELIFRDSFERYDYWPNPSSNANSDLWLIQHNDQLRVMRPRVPDWSGGNNFAYEQLYTEEFAGHFCFEDPQKPGALLRR